MSDIESAVPAQSDAAATPAPALTAVETAVSKDDFSAYRETRRAERSGTPAPAPVAEPVTDTKPEATAAPVEEPRTVSKRQHEINERIRIATERATADLAAENARLRSQIPAQPAAPRTAPADFPDYPEYLETHPDATLRDYNAAQFKHLRAQEQATEAADRQRTERQRSHQDAITSAHARTIAAREADPAIDAKFKAWETPGAELPEVLFIKTRDQAIAARQIPGAENDFASAVAASEFSAQLIAHIADHPEILQRVRSLDTRAAVVKFVGKLENRFESTGAIPVHQPKTISSAPTPGTALGTRPASATDPIAASVKNDDFKAYRTARAAERSAQRR